MEVQRRRPDAKKPPHRAWEPCGVFTLRNKALGVVISGAVYCDRLSGCDGAVSDNGRSRRH
eukprot:9371207-Alexandrium_andersonii.AAC.1